MKKLIVFICLLFVVTGCSKSINLDLNKVKNKVSNLNYEENKMFKDCEEINLETLKLKYDIDTTNIESILVMMPLKIESANMYMIVKSNNTLLAKQESDKIVNDYSNSWTLGYAPKEEQKVKNKLVEIKDNYIIYIISPDNELVLKTILNED